MGGLPPGLAGFPQACPVPGPTTGPMKKLPAALLLAAVLLPSCATSHAFRYSFGHESFFQKAEDNDSSRAIYGGPLILLSLGFDIATFPAQLFFGVWPWWGSKSRSMSPDKMEFEEV